MLIWAAAFSVAVPAVLFGWLWVCETVLAHLPPPTSRPLRGAMWMTPALLMVGAFLVWPLAYSAALSFRDSDGQSFVGLDNYTYVLSDDDLRGSLRNNVWWVVAIVLVPSIVGLIIAVVGNRVRYQVAVRAIVIAPAAISFVAGAVVWRSMYAYQPTNRPQTGTLNAVWTSITRGDPIAWLINTTTNNGALIVVGVWMATGFATVVLTAAVKNVPAELTEAAQVDGATAWQTFRYILLPQLRPALVVVATALAIAALKAFEIVYVMTNGAFDTNVLANMMYFQLFVAQHDGRASAIAISLSVLAAPIIYLNVRRASESLR